MFIRTVIGIFQKGLSQGRLSKGQFLKWQEWALGA